LDGAIFTARACLTRAAAADTLSAILSAGGAGLIALAHLVAANALTVATGQITELRCRLDTVDVPYSVATIGVKRAYAVGHHRITALARTVGLAAIGLALTQLGEFFDAFKAPHLGAAFRMRNAHQKFQLIVITSRGAVGRATVTFFSTDFAGRFSLGYAAQTPIIGAAG
jgi:hypothetical protein